MKHYSVMYKALTHLLAYPDERYAVDVNRCMATLQEGYPQATESLTDFTAFALANPISMLEEAFATTFDFDPDCSLELGWHLYGENYERGNFLVKMRGYLREYNLPESSELPDHLSHVMAVLGCMGEKEAHDFAVHYVIPGVKKLATGMAKKETPFRSLIACIQRVLQENHALTTGGNPHEH